MSRRFGRNQKRQFREALAQQEARAQRAERDVARAYGPFGELHVLRHENAKLKATFAYLESALQHYGLTAVLPPKTVRNGLRSHERKMAAPVGYDYTPPSAARLRAHAFTTLDLATVRYTLEQGDHATFLHFYVENADELDGRASYRISHDALRRGLMPQELDRLARDAARDTLRLLNDGLLAKAHRRATTRHKDTP